jgi:hypothetical protein
MEEETRGNTALMEVPAEVNPKELSAERLVDALDDPALRLAAEREIIRRLTKNKVNWHFYRLIAAWQSGKQAQARDAYKNLHLMTMAGVQMYHIPILTVTWKPNEMPLASYWDDIFHQTLVGNGQRKGEVERYLGLSARENLINALHYRYAGFIKRCGQRHKSEWLRDRFEHPRGIVTNAGEIKFRDDLQQEEIEALAESGIQVKDFEDVSAEGYLKDIIEVESDVDDPRAEQTDFVRREDMIPDPRWGGCDPWSTSRGHAEHVFSWSISIMEWTDKNERLIEKEVGSTSMWTWRIIAEALTDGEMHLTGLTTGQTRKEILELLAKKEGIGMRAAAKRLRQLRKSATLRSFLSDQIKSEDKFLWEAAPLVLVGRSRRKKEITVSRTGRRRGRKYPGAE